MFTSLRLRWAAYRAERRAAAYARTVRKLDAAHAAGRLSHSLHRRLRDAADEAFR